MNDIKKDKTEDKILNAAQEVFTKKGMDGTRMQEIADSAGINKNYLKPFLKKYSSSFFRKLKVLFYPTSPLKKNLAFLSRSI